MIYIYMKSKRNRVKRRNKLHSRKRSKKYIRKKSRKRSKKFSRKRSKKYGGADSPEGDDRSKEIQTHEINWLGENYELICIWGEERDLIAQQAGDLPIITFTDILGGEGPSDDYKEWARDGNCGGQNERDLRSKLGTWDLNRLKHIAERKNVEIAIAADGSTDEKAIIDGIVERSAARPCLLGQGQYGEVLFVINKREKPPREEAMKYLSPTSPAEKALIRKELEIIRKLKTITHANILTFYEAWPLERNKFIFTMEKLDGGDLAAVLLKARNEDGQVDIPKEIKLEYIRSMINGLKELHHMGIFHCDIKPENLLVAGDGVLKYTDFGLSQISENTRAIAPRNPDGRKTRSGSPIFASRHMIFYALRKRVQCIKEDGYNVEGVGDQQNLKMDKDDNVVVVQTDRSDSHGVWYAGYKENEDRLPDSGRTKGWFPASVVSELPSYCDGHLNDLWGMLVSITLLFGHKWLYETFFDDVIELTPSGGARGVTDRDLVKMTLLKNDYKKIKDELKVHMESLDPEIVDGILRLTLDTPKSTGLDDTDETWITTMGENVSGLNLMINKKMGGIEGVDTPAATW